MLYLLIHCLLLLCCYVGVCVSSLICRTVLYIWNHPAVEGSAGYFVMCLIPCSFQLFYVFLMGPLVGLH